MKGLTIDHLTICITVSKLHHSLLLPVKSDLYFDTCGHWGLLVSAFRGGSVFCPQLPTNNIAVSGSGTSIIKLC